MSFKSQVQELKNKFNYMNENQEVTNNSSTNSSKKSIISNLKVSCIEETSSGASTSPRDLKRGTLELVQQGDWS